MAQIMRKYLRGDVLKTVINMERVMKNYKELNNSDFKNGTFRIKKGGYYKLTEDIIFEPNKEDGFLPTRNQMKGGINAKYPVPPFGPYVLGFFSAITIECGNVVLDLSGFCIKQSYEFNLMQRFYANIELSNTPFIFKQGPANFSRNLEKTYNVYIKNGVLGRSSHHGIHGNNMRNVFIENLTIQDFEVAGIHLNGGEQIYIKDCTIKDQLHQRALSSLSQSIFLLPKLKAINKRNPTLTIKIEGEHMSGKELQKNIEMEMQKIINEEDYMGPFLNSTGLPDGNMYGVVLNATGVAVGPFKTKRDRQAGNQNIVLDNVVIKNIVSKGVEIKGIFTFDKEHGMEAYGNSQFVGPVGDVFNIKEYMNEGGKYSSNILGNAQLFICKHGKDKRELGTTNIPIEIVEWVEENELDIRTKICDCFEMGGEDENHIYYYKLGGDSMGHTMKGNIGIFVNAGKGISMNDITIDNIVNKSENKDVLLSSSTGILLSGSEDILIKNKMITNIVSDNGEAVDCKQINNTKFIRFL